MFLIINLYKFCTVYGKVFMNNIFLEMEVTMPILADQHLHSSFSGDSDEKMLDKFEVLSVADIFAAAIENVYLDKPMSKLYD